MYFVTFTKHVILDKISVRLKICLWDELIFLHRLHVKIMVSPSTTFQNATELI